MREHCLVPSKNSGISLLAILLILSLSDAVPLWSSVCTEEHPARDLPFCNVTLHLDERVDDYVHRIPLEQQVKMMGHKAKGYAPLGIPPYEWWSEGLHGPMVHCVNGKCPTSFPCPSGMANSFNATLFHQVAEAIGVEPGRGEAHDCVARPDVLCSVQDP